MIGPLPTFTDTFDCLSFTLVQRYNIFKSVVAENASHITIEGIGLKVNMDDILKSLYAQNDTRYRQQFVRISIIRSNNVTVVGFL